MLLDIESRHYIGSKICFVPTHQKSSMTFRSRDLISSSFGPDCRWPRYDVGTRADTASKILLKLSMMLLFHLMGVYIIYCVAIFTVSLYFLH